MKKHKRTTGRRINICWGYYVIVDTYNHTLYKNGSPKAIGFYQSLENAISGLIRHQEPELADSDLTSYVLELKKFKAKMINDILNCLQEPK